MSKLSKAQQKALLDATIYTNASEEINAAEHNNMLTEFIDSLMNESEPVIRVDFNANNKKIINLAVPVNDQDAATKKYVDDNSSSGHVIEEEGTPLPQQDTINFTGDGATATDAGGKTVVTIPGGIPEAPVDTFPYARKDAGWVRADTPDVNTWYLNSVVAVSGNGSALNPFKTIPEALAVGSSGDIFVFAPGDYTDDFALTYNVHFTSFTNYLRNGGAIISPAIITTSGNIILYLSNVDFDAGTITQAVTGEIKIQAQDSSVYVATPPATGYDDIKLYTCDSGLHGSWNCTDKITVLGGTFYTNGTITFTQLSGRLSISNSTFKVSGSVIFNGASGNSTWVTNGKLWITVNLNLGTDTLYIRNSTYLIEGTRTGKISVENQIIDSFEVDGFSFHKDNIAIVNGSAGNDTAAVVGGPSYLTIEAAALAVKTAYDLNPDDDFLVYIRSFDGVYAPVVNNGSRSYPDIHYYAESKAIIRSGGTSNTPWGDFTNGEGNYYFHGKGEWYSGAVETFTNTFAFTYSSTVFISASVVQNIGVLEDVNILPKPRAKMDLHIDTLLTTGNLQGNPAKDGQGADIRYYNTDFIGGTVFQFTFQNRSKIDFQRCKFRLSPAVHNPADGKWEVYSKDGTLVTTIDMTDTDQSRQSRLADFSTFANVQANVDSDVISDNRASCVEIRLDADAYQLNFTWTDCEFYIDQDKAIGVKVIVATATDAGASVFKLIRPRFIDTSGLTTTAIVAYKKNAAYVDPYLSVEKPVNNADVYRTSNTDPVTNPDINIIDPLSKFNALGTFTGVLIQINNSGTWSEYTLAADIPITFAESGHKEGEGRIVQVISDGTDKLTFTEPTAYDLLIPLSLTNDAILPTGIHKLGFWFMDGKIEVTLQSLQLITTPTNPILSNFRIDNVNLDRVYFDSDQILTGTTFAGFTLASPAKTVSAMTLTGTGLDNYLTVSAAYVVTDLSPTIAYSGADDIAGTGGDLLSFTATAISNNIAPQIVSMTVEDAAPNDLVVTADIASDFTNIGVVFRVDSTPRTLTSVAGTGTAVATYLISGAAITNGQVLDFAYDSTTGDFIGVTNGIELVTFAATTVTNNVAASYTFANTHELVADATGEGVTIINNDCYPSDGADTDEPVSWEFWYTPDAGSIGIIANIYTLRDVGSANASKILISKNAVNRISIRIIDVASTDEIVKYDITNTLSSATLYHVVITKTGETYAGVKIYIDGSEPSYGDSSIGTYAGIPAFVGNALVDISNSTAGAAGLAKYQVFRQFNAELTSSEVTTLYNSGSAVGLTAGLQAKCVQENLFNNNANADNIGVNGTTAGGATYVTI